MNAFDSICHGISAVATGGFSTKNNGIAAFNSTQINLIIGCAMLVGGLTFLELLNLFKNGLKVFYSNQQTKFYIKFIFWSVLLFTVFSFISDENNISIKTTVSMFFGIVSGITTSAFTLTDYNYHNQFFKILFFILPMIGACSGSSSGGIKLFRIQIIWEVVKTHAKKVIDPNCVVVSKYHNNIIQQSLIISVVVFFILFVFSFIVSVVLICAIGGYGMGTSTLVVGACLFNAGFPIDFLTTTSDTYFSTNTYTKIILMIDMLVGRLELIPIFMVCTSMFWRKK
jgi:trk system potassium uptake protein TrkH